MPIQQSKGAMPGTVAAPGLYLGTDTTSGLYQIGNSNVGLSIGGTKILDFSSSAVAVSSTSVLRAVGGLNTGPSEITPFAAGDVMISSSNSFRISYSGYAYKALSIVGGKIALDAGGLGLTTAGSFTVGSNMVVNSAIGGTMDLENTLTGGAGTGVCLFLNSKLTWSGSAASSVIAYYSTDGGGYAMFMRPNGNFENSYGSYGSTSDIKLKENIVDANPKLDKLLQLKVRNFNFIGKDETLIGFIAQELEEIMPGLISVSEDFDKDKNSLGTTTKSVKTSILIPILVKALQEMNVKVEDLTAKVAALEPK